MSGMSGGAQGYLGGEYTKKAARIEARDAQMAAQQIELEQVQREADRKERLARSMATTIASAGASGVSALEGSPLAVLQQSVRNEEKATQRDKYMSNLQAMTARYRGRMGVYSAKVQANAQHKAGRSQTFGTIFSFGMNSSSPSGQTQQPQQPSGDRNMAGGY